MRRLGFLLVASLVACESVVTPSPSPSVSPTVVPAATASPSPSAPREEMPRLLLTLPYAPPSVESLGATTARVGGISPRGPASLAVDANDRIYIWDQARLRVVVYESGKYMRAIALPFVEREATALTRSLAALVGRDRALQLIHEEEVSGANPPRDAKPAGAPPTTGSTKSGGGQNR